MSSNIKTGWERDRRIHFDEITDVYDKMRPEYPHELFKDILYYSGSVKDKKALEIGAGTGKATTPFLNAGYNVTAVELGENMAEFLRNKYKKQDGFKVIISSFEDALTEDNSYDLVYAATAFHWVVPEIGCPKAFRSLKKGGVFALFRYNAIPSTGELLYEEIQKNYEKYYYSIYSEGNRPVKKSHDDFCAPAEIKHGFGFKDLKDYGFNDISMKFYDITRTFTADEYILLMETMSDHRALPEDNRTALLENIRKAIVKFGGQIKQDYTFQLYMGRKP